MRMNFVFLKCILVLLCSIGSHCDGAGICYFGAVVLLPRPGRYRERGIVFARFLSFFLSFFVCMYLCIFVSLSARLRENGWTDLHEIFREGVECGVTMGRPDSILGQFG